MHHAMIDTETWGKLPGCALRSIGAVMFDPVAGTLGARFYVNITRASGEAVGLHVDKDTEAWWGRQGAAAQAALEPDQRPLLTALVLFADWWREQAARHPWCHGATFDEPILRLAFLACRLPVPWDFWNARDTRTLYDLAGVKPDKAEGVEHHALDDAVRQARAACVAYGRLTRRVGDGLAAEPVQIVCEMRFDGPLNSEQLRQVRTMIAPDLARATTRAAGLGRGLGALLDSNAREQLHG